MINSKVRLHIPFVQDTPLHYGAYNGCEESVATLLQIGASAHVTNAAGNTPRRDAELMLGQCSEGGIDSAPYNRVIELLLAAELVGS